MYDFKGSKKLLSSTEDRPIFEDLEGLRPSQELDPRGQGLQKPASRPPPLLFSAFRSFQMLLIDELPVLL